MYLSIMKYSRDRGTNTINIMIFLSLSSSLEVTARWSGNRVKLKRNNFVYTGSFRKNVKSNVYTTETYSNS